MNSEASHLDDGALIRVLDRETAPDDEAVSHARACPQCSARLATLQSRSGNLAFFVKEDAAEIPPPTWDALFLRRMTSTHPARPQRVRAGWRWAVAAALVATVLSVAPVRAWLVEHAAAAWHRMSGTEEGGGADAAPPGASTEIRTPMTGAMLVVGTSAGSAPDTMVVRSVAGNQVRAAIRGGGPGAEILVRAGGLDVQAPEPGGVLDVGIPPSVRVVRVIMDGRVRAERSFESGETGVWRVVLRR